MKLNNWIFIGSIAGDNTDKRAVSAAGQITQSGFLKGCLSDDQKPIEVISMDMLRIFPYGKLFIASNFTSGIQNIGFINLPLIKQISFALNIMPKILTKRPKAIICYNPSFALLIIGGMFQLISKTSFVPIIYDIIIPGKNTGNELLAYLNYQAYKFLLRYFPVISISQPIIKDFNINRYIIVEGGLPEDTIQKYSSSDTISNASKEKFKIVFAGGLELENGILQILDAMELLKDEDIELYLYGSGPLEKQIKSNYSNLQNLTIMGQTEHYKVIEALKNADLLLNIRIDKRISTKYFFPSKLIEYLYSGVPILSTDFESLPEEYKQYLYITEEEPENIADKMLKIKNSPILERQAFAERGKKWVLQEKTWQQQSKKILNWVFQKQETKI